MFAQGIVVRSESNTRTRLWSRYPAEMLDKLLCNAYVSLSITVADRSKSSIGQEPYFLHLTRGHGFRHQSLQCKLLLLEVVRRRVLNLKLGHGVAEGSLDFLLGTAFELQGHCGVGNNFFDSGDVGFELLSSFKLLTECIVAILKLRGIYLKLA